MKKISTLSKLFLVSIILSFNAFNATSQVLLNEDFSSGLLPVNWTTSSVSAGDLWEYGGSVDFGSTSTINDPFGNSGEYAHIDFSDDPDTTSLITPIVDISTLTNPRLTFYYISQTTSTSFSPYNRLIVDYWDGAAWINITVIDTLTTVGWTEYDFNISTYTFGTDSVQFRFSAQEGGAAIGGTGTATFDQDLALDDVTIEETPTCLEASGIFASTVQDTSLTFSWTENNAATQWEIEWETTANYNMGTSNISIINTDTFAILNGLTASTEYTFRVRAICAVGDTSLFSVPVSVLTSCPASFTAPYSEAFDSFTPVCWDQAGDGTPATGYTGLGASDWRAEEYLNTLANGGGAAINLFSSTDEEWILSPNFDLSIGGPHELLVDAGVTNWLSSAADNMGSDDEVQVLISTDTGATWTAIQTWDVNNQPPTLGQTYIIDLSAYSGAANLFAIWATDGAVNDIEDYDFHIGNFEIRERPNCPEPIALDFSSITDSSVAISWTEGGTATEWIVEWDTAGYIAGAGSNSVVVNTDTFTTVNGLSGNTTYDFYVRAICGVGDTSSYSSSGTATTLCNPFIAPFSEDFNALTLPDCWSQGAGNSEDWEFQLTDGHIGNVGNQGSGSTTSGGGLASVDDSSPHNTNTTLESPLIDVSGLTTPRLTFFTISDNEGNLNGNVDFHVDVYDGANWNDSIFFSDTNTIGGTWEQIIVDLSTLTITGPIQVRFVVDENNGTLFDDDRAIDDVVVEETPSCPSPTALGFNNITDSSVVISWTNGGTETEWEIEYDTAGFTLGTGNVVSTTTNPDTIGGLQSATTYDFYVRAVCAIGDSSNYTSVSGTTKIATAKGVNCINGSAATVFSDDLESLNGWSGDIGTGTTDSQWNYDANGTTSSNTGPSAAYSGTQYVYVETSSAIVGDSVSFISPAIDLTNASDFAELSFWLHAYGADIGTINVGVGTSATGPFTEEFSYTGEVQSDELDPFENVGVNLDAYVGQTIYIEFLYITNGSFEGDIALDLIEVTSCLPCPIPISLTSSNITSNSADINWSDSTASQWIVEYDTAGFTPGAGSNSVVVDTNTFTTLTGLASQTAYDFYVRAICSPGDTSAYSDTASFSTTVCSDPTALSSANVSIDSASLSWTENGTAMQWEISYGSTGFTAGNGTQVVANVNPFNLLGLSSNTSYDWYVRAICGAGDTSNWSDTASFTTLSVPLPYYSIGTINGEDSTGVADSLNVACYTSGTVTGVDRRGSGYEFALIDLSSGVQEGITVFDFNDLSNYTNPVEGDSLEVYGSVDQFNGLTQFRPDSIIIINSGTATVATPILVTDLDETTESKLVELNDNFVLLDPSGSFSYNMDATNGTDTITIRVDSDTDVDDSLSVMTNSLVVGDTICGLIGIGGQFDGSSPFTEGYQVFPSRYSDLTICRLSVGIKDVETSKASFTISPNPTSGEFTIRTTGFNNASVRVLIRDISGRIISDEILTNANNRINKTMNLSENAKGLYFINIFDGDAVIHQKLILR